jgi:hypothetical protein
MTDGPKGMGDIFDAFAPKGTGDSVEALAERRKIEHGMRDAHLDMLGFSPVVRIAEGGIGGGLFYPTHEFTTCRNCGAVVRLGDTMENPGESGPERIERGVQDHWNFHLRIGDPLPHPENKET